MPLRPEESSRDHTIKCVTAIDGGSIAINLQYYAEAFVSPPAFCTQWPPYIKH